MKKIFFTKMSGAGNDFIFFDKNQNPDINLLPETIKKLCDRRNGIGADGVIEIANHSQYDFEMIYYNADGSAGSLCGNGARCAIWFASKTGRLNDENAKFISAGKEYSGKVITDELIKFNLNQPAKIKFNFKIKAFGQLIKANYADTGSPHVVINISDIQKNPSIPNVFFDDILEVPVYQIGKEVRYHYDFAPEGTNVNFVKVVNNEILIRTYERGVENETLACGTGSVAAALICSVTDKLNPPITLKTYGGDKLSVNFEVENQRVKNPSITGPAKIVFEGSINKDLFI
jgi:diaminopimelate epimerase